MPTKPQRTTSKAGWTYNQHTARWTDPNGRKRFAGEVCWTCRKPITPRQDLPVATCRKCAGGKS